MTDAAPRQWTIEEFFAWQEKQPERYELVDGFPVRMMAGAKNVHDDIVVNVLAELRNQLRGTACRPFTGDGSIETKPGQIRRPDVRRRLRTKGPERDQRNITPRRCGGSLAHNAGLRYDREARPTVRRS